MNFKRRIGQFLFFISLIVELVFLATLMADEPGFLLFPIGLVGIILGLTLMLRNRTPPPPSGRFRTIRSVQQKLAERGDARETKDKKT